MDDQFQLNLLCDERLDRRPSRIAERWRDRGLEHVSFSNGTGPGTFGPPTAPKPWCPCVVRSNDPVSHLRKEPFMVRESGV